MAEEETTTWTEEAIWAKHLKDETYDYDSERKWRYGCRKTGFRLQTLDADYFTIDAKVYCGHFGDESLLLDPTEAIANLAPHMVFDRALIETFDDWDRIETELDFVVKKLLVQLVRTMCINERGTLIVTNEKIPEEFKKPSEWPVTRADILIDITLTDFYHKSSQWPDPSDKDIVSVYVAQSRHTSQQRPTFLSVVAAHYVLETTDGDVILDTRKLEGPHIFTIGAGDVPIGVDLSISGLTWEQRAFSHIGAIAGFPNEEAKKELLELSASRSDALLSFIDGYESTFDQDGDYRSNREFFLKQPNPNDYNSDGERERKKNQELRAAGIKPTRRHRDDFWELGSTEKTPRFGLTKSSIDFEPFRQAYQGKALVMRDIHLVQVYRLYSHDEFPREQWVEYFGSYREIGRRFFRVKDYCRALKVFAELEYKLSTLSGLPLELEAAKVQINLNLAITHCNLGHYETALPLLEKHILRRPDDPKALYWLAKIYLLHNEDLAGAEEFVQRALRIEPHNRECMALRKTIRSQRGAESGLGKNMQYLDLIRKAGFGDSRETTAVEEVDDCSAMDTNLLRNFGIVDVVPKSDLEMSHLQPIEEIKTATEELCQ